MLLNPPHSSTHACPAVSRGVDFVIVGLGKRVELAKLYYVVGIFQCHFTDEIDY